jgi:DNA-binding NarL/FixJ family response regulator
MSAEITVAIADDHKIFRKGVILSLRHYPNIKVCFRS